ncbi:MAG: hypothetical protein V3R65_09465 [Acidiferrobacterales bacterium]
MSVRSGFKARYRESARHGYLENHRHERQFSLEPPLGPPDASKSAPDWINGSYIGPF